MYNNNHQEADIYALLSEDPLLNDPTIDNPNLLGMFNNHDYLLEHPLSNDLNQGFSTFDFTPHYTPPDPFSYQRRRHSVAVNLLNPEIIPPPLSTVDHRASMPNIFHPPPSDRLGPTSVKPNHSPIQFNALPWSNDTPVRHKRSLSQQYSTSLAPPMSGIASRRMSTATPNDISTWHKMAHSTQEEKPSETIKEEQEEDIEDYPNITDADVEAAKCDPSAIPRRQKLRYEGDEYTPKWVRYTGQLKEGYCDTCPSGKWLQLKNSAYWYHKQFFHGISSVSGKRFQNPLEQRHGEHDSLEGLCHQCQEFVPVCNSKRKNSVLWYRHAHKCHIYDRPKTRMAGSRRASVQEQPLKKTKFL
ncbi:hypothetical protein CU098_009332 [Rhizopus stolonifer]|uniref:Transcription regulator Rua1 C-terminal domain-containing protein n=1 Tax=Rhizopus stolonifer TaxID=4846 RepID=A0A367KI17_RHIST|nr:hypothetical protein CU098_009332 [Rhizopus stolonifer]